MQGRTCKICRESTPEILNTINRLIAKATEHREIERLSGFSRSTIWRHDPIRDPHHWQTLRQITRQQLLPPDVIVRLNYYEPQIRNRAALRLDDLGSQQAFLLHCPKHAQEKFIAYLHQKALEENQGGTFSESVIGGDFCPWPRPSHENISDITDDSPEALS